MRVAGVIAEYNPFHNGHAYQLAQLRQMGFDAVVCVVSSGVCQRGEVSLLPFAVRVRAALCSGADLVITLPAPYACASAEQFSASGVSLLTALGCVDALAFGAETPDAEILMRTARALQDERFAERLRENLADGTEYAAARAAAAQSVCDGAGQVLRTPNNILAVEYCKAVLRQNSPLQILPLPRKGAQHGSAQTDGAFASAGALRQLWLAQGVQAALPYVPAACAPLYVEAAQSGQTYSPQTFDIALLSRLRGQSAAELRRVRGMAEGLENRLLAALQTAQTAAQLYDAMKCKRYAHARLRRLALDAALQIPADLPPLPPFIHIAGGTQTGLALLRGAHSSLPVSARLAHLAGLSLSAQRVAFLHAAAEDFSALCRQQPQPCGAAYTQKFIKPPFPPGVVDSL